MPNRDVMTRWSLLELSVLVVAPLPAQTPAKPLPQQPTLVVSGVVFDSVAHAPLARAVVQVASLDPTKPPFSAIADSTGHFRFTGLPSGRFVIGFEHDALRALGLESPLRTFELAADTNLKIDLAIPPGSVVRALRCGARAVEARDGMLAGFVRDARRHEALPRATVAAEWHAIVLDPGNFHTELQRVVASVSDDGTYLLCGLPGDAPLRIQVAGPGHRVIVGEISVPIGGATRRDFHLADTAEVHGTATLTGRVVHERGRPVTSGRAAIAALALEVPVRNGAFALKGLPLGTWEVEVRVVGLGPRSALIDVTESRNASMTITVSERTQQLDAVTVVGEPSRELTILDEVLRRKRSSFGTVFLPDNSWLQSAHYVADVLRAARGFSYKSPDMVLARQECRPAPSVPDVRNPNPKTLPKYVQVYLDGDRFPLGLAGLSDMIPMRDVLAVEAYPDVLFAPVQWRTNDACAVVAVWTKR